MDVTKFLESRDKYSSLVQPHLNVPFYKILKYDSYVHLNRTHVDRSELFLKGK